jgi:hypothetical protein
MRYKEGGKSLTAESAAKKEKNRYDKFMKEFKKSNEGQVDEE